MLSAAKDPPLSFVDCSSIPGFPAMRGFAYNCGLVRTESCRERNVLALLLSGRVSPVAALGHRNFRLLYLGLLVSTLGSQITRAASAWVIYELTGSAAALGLAGLFAALPLIPMSLFGGALADAVERRRLLL